jgi:hypothetical protein
VNLWLEGFAADRRFDLSSAQRVLEDARAQVAAETRKVTLSLTPEQEFIQIKLPKFLARQLNNRRAAAVVEQYRDSRIYNDIKTATVDDDWLTLGPEAPGTIEGIKRYLQEQFNDKTRDSVLVSFRYTRAIPFVFAAVLLFTWLLPLASWSIGVISAATVLLLLVSLLPGYYVGWRSVMRRPETIASIGFFGICVFGIAYAICGLVNSMALGPLHNLGYPFLVSTSLGIAGGVLGEPHGVVRWIIHLQLLLFFGGLMSLIAILLKIERDVGSRG